MLLYFFHETCFPHIIRSYLNATTERNVIKTYNGIEKSVQCIIFPSTELTHIID